MKRLLLISSLLVLLGALSLVSLPTPANAQAARITIFMYAAKSVCGKEDGRLVSPGQYFTVVNVHNSSPVAKAVYIKRFAIALPEERPGKISNVVGGTLGPDEAMSIECENIYKHTGTAPGSFLDGFALLYSLTELDVVPVYTAGHSEVEALHTERVPVRKFVIARNQGVARDLIRQQSIQ